MLGVGMLKDETVIGKDLTYLQLFNPPVHDCKRWPGGGHEELAPSRTWSAVPLPSAARTSPRGRFVALMNKSAINHSVHGHLGNQKAARGRSQRGSGLQWSL